MGFISNFLLLVTTLLKLWHAGKKKKKEREKGKPQKCLEISCYDEAQNYFYFTKARDMG